MAVIEATDLQKRYGDVVALDGVSFRVEAGEVFALLGPNGAGKTTTVEILEGYRSQDSGEVTVLGTDANISVDVQGPLSDEPLLPVTEAAVAAFVG